MRAEDAVTFVELVLGRSLSKAQIQVFLLVWENKSYSEIADLSGYSYDYIKQIGSKLWRSLSELSDSRISKNNLQSSLCRYAEEKRISVRPDQFL